MKIKNIIFSVLTLSLGCAVFTFCKEKLNIKTSKNYKGTITVSLCENTISIYKSSYLIYNEYILEAQTTIHNFSSSTLNEKGIMVPDKNKTISYKSLDEYTLANLKDSTCTVFDTTVVKPVFKSIIPLSKKIRGLTFTENLKDIKDHLNDFVLLKDTLINKANYKILVYNSPNAKQIGYKQIILYSNNELKDFPYHPISKTLDRKFNGLVDKVVFIANNGYTLSAEYAYNDGLNKKEQNKILEFIKEAKRHTLPESLIK